jgi:hypothetical protein
MGALAVADTIKPSEAGQHIGNKVTVCGKVRSTRYAFTWKGKPTLLNLDSVDDNFAIVIWGKHRKNFRSPDFDYADKQLCVTGKIRKDKGHLRVEAQYPTQIVVAPAVAGTPGNRSLFDEIQGQRRGHLIDPFEPNFHFRPKANRTNGPS